MTKMISDILYFLLFIGVTVVSYATFFFVDYSADYFTILRILVMCVCFLYFYKLTGHLDSLKIAKQKLNKYPSAKDSGQTLIAFCLFFIHLILVNVGGKSLNEKLLSADKRQTTATIKDCYSSKGTEYCVYEYSVDNKHYEVKYCNESDNLKFKESDTTTVIYYSKFPVISRLKKELQ